MCHVVPHGIETSILDPNSATRERPSWLQKEKCNIIYVGTDDPRKRLDFALQIIGELPNETKKVTEALEIAVTGGEQDCDIRIWQDLIDRKVTDIMQPDVMYMGGLTRALRVAEMANKANIPCTPHAANLSLVTICTMHFLKSIPNSGKYLELSIEGSDYYPWQVDLFDGTPFEVKEGQCSIPSDPGWGVDFNKKWLEKSSYTLCEI